MGVPACAPNSFLTVCLVKGYGEWNEEPLFLPFIALNEG